MTALNIAAIRAEHPLSAVVGRSVKLRKNGREFSGCCPFHPDRTPSFTVNDDKGFYHCFGCGAHGDVLDFVRAVENIGLREAAVRLGPGALPAVSRAVRPDDADPDTVGAALAIWRAASPVSGTPAEAYLRGRGLWLPIPDSIRFAMLRYGTRGPLHPCLVAVLASPDNKVVGVQRTFLKADGSGKAAVPKPKLSLGRVRGGAIRLAPAAGELIVCEGLEDGLTLQQELGRAVWVAAGASMLPSMRLPVGVRSVVIGADADNAGERSAAAAADAFSREGRAVRIIRPEPGHKDFNAELQRDAA